MKKKNVKRELEYYKTLEGIKKVTRYQPFEKLHENVAGHCYMAVMLANDLMCRYDLNLDKSLVFEMLLVHDLSELGMTFDFPADVVAKSNDLKTKKQQLEVAKVKKLSEDFDRPQIQNLFSMFEEKTTREALFANLVDKLEAALYILTNECAGFKCNDDFEFILHYPDKFVAHFPELKDVADEIKAGIEKHYKKFKHKISKK